MDPWLGNPLAPRLSQAKPRKVAARDKLEAKLSVSKHFLPLCLCLSP